MEIGKIYKTKFQTGEKFLITDLVKDSKGKIIKVLGIYENSPHLTNCPLNPERLIIEN